MGTINLILAVANIFIAGMQFSLWLRSRHGESLAWAVMNLLVGVYCMIAGVGALVNENIGV